MRVASCLQAAHSPSVQKWGLPAAAAAALGVGVYCFNSRPGVVEAGVPASVAALYQLKDASQAPTSIMESSC